MQNPTVSTLDSSAHGILSRRHLVTTQNGFASTISGGTSEILSGQH